MEALKKIFYNLDFHLNTQQRTLSICYGKSSISLCLNDEGKMRLDTNLVLEGSSTKNLETNAR